jgi:hypothetical protein
MNIDTLKAEIGARKGLAAANRFSVVWPVVRGVRLVETTTVFCQTISLPGRTIQTQEFQNQDVMSSFPFVYDDGDVSLTFILTNDYYVYDFFISWMEKVIDTEKYIAGYKKDYKANMTLIHEDTKNSPIKEFKIIDCWPKSITPIELSTTNENQFSIFTVTLSFKNFKLNPSKPSESIPAISNTGGY